MRCRLMRNSSRRVKGTILALGELAKPRTTPLLLLLRISGLGKRVVAAARIMHTNIGKCCIRRRHNRIGLMLSNHSHKLMRMIDLPLLEIVVEGVCLLHGREVERCKLSVFIRYAWMVLFVFFFICLSLLCCSFFLSFFITGSAACTSWFFFFLLFFFSLSFFLLLKSQTLTPIILVLNLISVLWISSSSSSSSSRIGLFFFIYLQSPIVIKYSSRMVGNTKQSLGQM